MFNISLRTLYSTHALSKDHVHASTCNQRSLSDTHPFRFLFGDTVSFVSCLCVRQGAVQTPVVSGSRFAYAGTAKKSREYCERHDGVLGGKHLR
jgi:hypothetical protein